MACLRCQRTLIHTPVSLSRGVMVKEFSVLEILTRNLNPHTLKLNGLPARPANPAKPLPLLAPKELPNNELGGAAALEPSAAGLPPAAAPALPTAATDSSFSPFSLPSTGFEAAASAGAAASGFDAAASAGGASGAAAPSPAGGACTPGRPRHTRRTLIQRRNALDRCLWA